MNDLDEILNNSLSKAHSGIINKVNLEYSMGSLIYLLSRISLEDDDSKQKHVQLICRKHDLHQICLQDPYTRRSFEKPRGFSGDARLVDFFYGYNGPTFEDTDLGASLFSYFMTFDACDSVRFRRCYLASEIDRECRRLEGTARIASIACGHLREAKFSLEVAARNFDVLFALDSDEKALDQIKRQLTMTK